MKFGLFATATVSLMLTARLSGAEAGCTNLPLPKFTGSGSCGSPSCHGGIAARMQTSVLQNEYSTWIAKDKHTKAYSALTGDLGLQMARILQLKSPEKEEKCLVCHGLKVSDQRTLSFDTQDGVGCENCHGAASNWLEKHTEKGWSYEKSVSCLKMYDTRNLITRSERCLSCHLGDKERSVDHRMIAAGHPDLYFEADSFEAVQPRHWKEPIDKDPWIGVRTLATGQAVQLGEVMRRISRRVNSNYWPEYAELDCFSCHHSLTPPVSSWRQKREYPGRPPGNPPLNESRYAVLQTVVSVIDSEGWAQLQNDVAKVYELVSRASSDRAQSSDRNTINERALSAADKANRLAQRLATLSFDQATTVKLLKRICADSDRISAQGERAAEQAAMSLDSLLVAYSVNSKLPNQDQVSGAIKLLFTQLDTPSSYNPANFSRQMRAVGALLP